MSGAANGDRIDTPEARPTRKVSMSNPRTTFLRRIAGAVAVPVALVGLLAGPTAAEPAAAAVRAAEFPAGSEAPAEPQRPLRVMPLGDSITFGTGSSTFDGYRKDLHRRLTSAGLDVNFVGSLHSGTGADTNHEGHKGWTIQRLANHVDRWLADYEPDVILLHIGTNDMVRDIPGAATRLDRLLDRIAAARPEAEVFVAQIVGLADYPDVAGQQERTAAFNRAVPRIVQDKGERFHLVDQSGIHGIDMFNREHPNDYGYRQISWNWYRAMQPVLSRGESWPTMNDPYRAGESYRCLAYTVLDPAAVGCHYWYNRPALGGRAWMLPVRERVAYQVKVNGHIETRVKFVTRWVTAA
jgi:lysophospholipase L1-like esterase